MGCRIVGDQFMFLHQIQGKGIDGDMTQWSDKIALGVYGRSVEPGSVGRPDDKNVRIILIPVHLLKAGSGYLTRENITGMGNYNGKWISWRVRGFLTEESFQHMLQICRVGWIKGSGDCWSAVSFLFSGRFSGNGCEKHQRQNAKHFNIPFHKRRFRGDLSLLTNISQRSQKANSRTSFVD